MNTSLNWIKAMVPGLECTDQEFRDAMTLSGTKVECFNAFDKNLDKIVVGQILSVETSLQYVRLMLAARMSRL